MKRNIPRLHRYVEVEVRKDRQEWRDAEGAVEVKHDDHIARHRLGFVIPVDDKYGPAQKEANADNDGFAVCVGNTRMYVYNRVEEDGYITDFRRDTEIDGRLIVELHSAYGIDQQADDAPVGPLLVGPQRWYVAHRRSLISHARTQEVRGPGNPQGCLGADLGDRRWPCRRCG